MASSNTITDIAALEKLIRLQRLLNSIGSICGVDVFRVDYQVNVKTRVTIAAIIVYILFTIYTLLYFMGDISRQLQTVCVYGIIITGIKKLSLAYFRHSDFHTYMEFMETVYRQNTTGKRPQILKKCIDDTIKMTKFVLAATFFAAALYGLYPAYLFVAKGGKELIMNILIPTVDHESLWGYLFTSFIHVLAALYGVSGTLTFDIFFQISVCNYNCLIELLNDSLQTLGMMWQTNRGSIKYRKLYLRNILLQFQDTNRYITDLNDIVHSVVGYQVACLSTSMALSLFCITVNNWIGGFGYFIFALILFLCMSYLGTIIQNGNQKLCDIIYASSWYLMPIEEQRLILMQLLKTQNAMELWIGPIAPLNVESGLAVLKTIYQLFMMMLEFLKD